MVPTVFDKVFAKNRSYGSIMFKKVVNILNSGSSQLKKVLGSNGREKTHKLYFSETYDMLQPERCFLSDKYSFIIVPGETPYVHPPSSHLKHCIEKIL